MLPRGLTQGTMGVLYYFCLAHLQESASPLPPIHRGMTPFPPVSLPSRLHQRPRSEKHQSMCSKECQPQTSTVNSVAPDDWLLARDIGERQERPS